MRKWVAVGVGVVVLTVLAAFAGYQLGRPGREPGPAVAVSFPPSTFTVEVVLQVEKAMYGAAPGDPCFMSGGYSDIGAGTQVRVVDDTGRVIALGALGVGEAVDTLPDVKGTDRCRFEATVAEVPMVDVFGVEVAHRGVVNFKREDDPTLAELTLG